MRIAALRRDPSGKPKGVVIVAIILREGGQEGGCVMFEPKQQSVVSAKATQGAEAVPMIASCIGTRGVTAEAGVWTERMLSASKAKPSSTAVNGVVVRLHAGRDGGKWFSLCGGCRPAGLF